jgi:hypothetical protein
VGDKPEKVKSRLKNTSKNAGITLLTKHANPANLKTILLYMRIMDSAWDFKNGKNDIAFILKEKR